MNYIIILLNITVFIASTSYALYVQSVPRTLGSLSFSCAREFVPVSRCRTEDMEIYVRVHAELSRGNVDRAIHEARQWLERQFSAPERSQVTAVKVHTFEGPQTQMEPTQRREQTMQTSNESRQRRCERSRQTYMACCDRSVLANQQCNKVDAILDDREARLQSRFDELDAAIRERYERAYDVMFEEFERDWMQERQAGH